MNKTLLISSILFLILSSCGLRAFLKTYDAFEKESMTNQPFKQTIPFEEVGGQIIIQAEIDGVIKNYLFDTGSTMHIKKKYPSQMKTQKLGKLKTVDSNNKKRYIEYVTLDELKIGKISFYDLVVSKSDMTVMNQAFCTDVSGIIGANAMNKSIWQIDYKNHFITMTNSRDSLTFSGNQQNFYFTAAGKGVPTISVSFNDASWGEAIIDTGSNGTIAMDEKYLPSNTEYIEKQVYVSGVFSEEEVYQKLATIPSMRLNNSIEIDDQVVNFENKRPFGIIGNRFLKNYKVTIDWIQQEILLDPHEKTAIIPDADFGFYPRFIDGQVVVGSIRMNSPAYTQGIRLNNQIIRVNDIDFKENTYEKFCNYYTYFGKSCEKIELTVLQENELFQVVLSRSDVLEIVD